MTGPGRHMTDVCDLRFDNSFVRELPGDPLLHNVPRACATPATRESIRHRSDRRNCSPGPTR